MHLEHCSPGFTTWQLCLLEACPSNSYSGHIRSYLPKELFEGNCRLFAQK
jgi:hypothetical protein